MLLRNLLLALVWAAMSGSFSASSLVLGLVLGGGVLAVTHGGYRTSAYLQRIRKVGALLVYFVAQLVLSSLRVAWDVVTPRHRMRPGIVSVPLAAATDLEIALLANAITLTPGSLSIDVAPDRSTLYVHVMYIDDLEAIRRGVKDGFERRILEVLR